jgi:hypothetical protein
VTRLCHPRGDKNRDFGVTHAVTHKAKRKEKRKEGKNIYPPPTRFAEDSRKRTSEEEDLFRAGGAESAPAAEKQVLERGPVLVPDAEAFGQFWAVYPRHVAKEAARKAFDAAIKKHHIEPDRLIEGAKRYAGERAGQDPKFTKHPATWLNGGCWEDEPPNASGGPPVLDGATGEIIPTTQPPRRSRFEEFQAEMLAKFCGEVSNERH